MTPKVRRLKPGGGRHCHCRASLGLFSPKQVVWRVGQPHPYAELRRRSRQHPDELTTEDRSRALPCAEEAIGPQRHGGRGKGQRTGPARRLCCWALAPRALAGPVTRLVGEESPGRSLRHPEKPALGRHWGESCWPPRTALESWGRSLLEVNSPLARAASSCFFREICLLLALFSGTMVIILTGFLLIILPVKRY